mgnify:CR=1 FL=1
MKQSSKYWIVLVTAPDAKTARKLAKLALQARLAACANLIPRIESHYWLQGKLESSDEVLMLFKTTAKHLAALEALVLAKHPYDTPEFVAVPIARGNRRYLAWLKKSVTRKT